MVQLGRVCHGCTQNAHVKQALTLSNVNLPLGGLRYLAGIMTVATAETEPDRAGPSKPSQPSKPLANPLMARFLGKEVVIPAPALAKAESADAQGDSDSQDFW